MSFFDRTLLYLLLGCILWNMVDTEKRIKYLENSIKEWNKRV
jgi:hypothetical protein